MDTLVKENPPIVASLPTAVLKIVKEDPFASIREIVGFIRKEQPALSVSWWKVFSVLKQNKLLSKKSRFKYVRGFF